MSRGGGNSGFRSQLTPSGQCAFPTLNRRGLRSSGWESRPGESHPEALAEPYVTLSRHTAPIKEPPRIVAQGANRCGERRETAATHRLARRT
jgi:hypothetical protein